MVIALDSIDSMFLACVAGKYGDVIIADVIRYKMGSTVFVLDCSQGLS